MNLSIMKKTIAEIAFILLSCQTIMGQNALQMQRLNTSCDTIELQTNVSFTYGDGSICPNLSGFVIGNNTDTLTLSLYYNTSGPYPQFGCTSTDTIKFKVSSNKTILKGITYSIFEGDTSKNAISVSTLLLCTTGIPENQLQLDFIIYPNPSIDYIIVKVISEFKNVKYCITNLMGITLLTGDLTGKETIINLNELEIGFYTIQLGYRPGQVFKVIKK